MKYLFLVIKKSQSGKVHHRFEIAGASRNAARALEIASDLTSGKTAVAEFLGLDRALAPGEWCIHQVADIDEIVDMYAAKMHPVQSKPEDGVA